MAPAGLGAGGVDEGRLVRLPDRRQRAAADGCRQHLRRDPRPGAVRLSPGVEEGDLADHRGDRGIVDAGGERVATAHRGAEGRDPGGVDSWLRAGAGDRRTPVVELSARVEAVGLAAAVAEAAVVEQQRRDPGRGEALGEGAEAVAPRPREAVRHHRVRRGARGSLDRIQPRRAGVALNLELDVFSFHAGQTPAGSGT